MSAQVTSSTSTEATDAVGEAAELRSLREGLGRKLPEIDPKYFYDARGSELFEAITGTPEYYPTRTEVSILRTYADEIVQRCDAVELAEFGSGAGLKIRLLLDAMTRARRLERVILFDISREPLLRSMAELEEAYDGLSVRAIEGDFHHDVQSMGTGGQRLVLFFAGTIGNFTRPAATRFLADVRATMAPSDAMLLGVDLVKDKPVLDAAYNDAAGYTAAFNRNALHVINQRFGANFRPDAWQHIAFYDVDEARIEMRLRAAEDMHVAIPSAGISRDFAAGDEIRTEISCKYTRTSLDAMLTGSGLALDAFYTDEHELFGLAMLRPADARRDD